jgi:hypothetical protein
MKKRTRLFLLVAVSVLVVGLGTGLVASYVGLPGLGIIGGDGPDELTYVPADVRLVAYADVHELATSELRQKMRAFQVGPDGQNKFETETGIDIERDVDHVLAAAWGPQGNGPQGPPLVLAHGRFDTVRIEGMAREHGATVEEYKGKRLVVMSTDGPAVSVAFLEPGLVAFGAAALVRRAIDTNTDGGGVRGNAEVMRLVKDVDDGNAWAVAKFDALSAGQLPREISQQLPPINWFAASGHVDGGLRGEVVRGFMALARMQAGQKAEFSELVNSLELGGQGTTVSIGFSIPANLLEQMGAGHAARRRAPRAPDAPAPPARPQPPSPPSL